MIEDGIAASDVTTDPELDEIYYGNRALALARCRAMPVRESAAVISEFDEAARAALVSRFLNEVGGPLPPGPAARLARLIVDYGCDRDSGQPLRVGPGKFSTFLADWVPDEELPEEEQDAADRRNRAENRRAGERQRVKTS